MLNLLKSIKLVLALAAMTVVFYACQKEELATPLSNTNAPQTHFFNLTNGPSTDTDEDSDDGDEDWGEEDCFSIVFPVEVVFPEGSTQTVNNEEDLDKVIDEWFDQNPEAEDFPTFTFPIKVVMEEDPTTEIAINSEEELCDLYYECEDFEEDFCYDFVFPLDVALPDGTVSTAQDEDQLYQIVDDWFIANEDSEEYPDFVYPIQILDETDNLVTVYNAEELDDLEDECYDEDFLDCFSIDYPYQVELPTGELLTINNEEEEDKAIDQWLEENPEIEELPELVYPLTITLDDDSKKTINSAEEFDTELEACFGEDFIKGESLQTGGSQTLLTKKSLRKD